jgi:predicted nucleic acid-binding protein
MSVLVDTNVLSDVIHADAQWEQWAAARLCEFFGRSFINPIIYAELGCRAISVEELEETLLPFQLEYREIPKEALFLAAQVFLSYRQRGGAKTAPLPDFFIGAHASVLGVPLVTRDVGRYQTYFPEVELITPPMDF